MRDKDLSEIEIVALNLGKKDRRKVENNVVELLRACLQLLMIMLRKRTTKYSEIKVGY